MKKILTLILAGIKIPYELGEKAHSDGDVVYHAVAESLLGALALGDLGTHFPDNDDKYKGISSVLLLKEVGEKLADKCFLIENIDATIIASAKPTLDPISVLDQPINNTLNGSFERFLLLVLCSTFTCSSKE